MHEKNMLKYNDHSAEISIKPLNFKYCLLFFYTGTNHYLNKRVTNI